MQDKGSCFAGAANKVGQANTQAQWQDYIWWSGDGVRLHARLYPGPDDAAAYPPILCLPGLTRNARDFEDLAPHLAQKRRVYVLEFRGRGESAFARDPMTYVPLTYVQDVVALLDDQKIDHFVTVGTSLGGLVAMLMAASMPNRMVGALLNDVGPELQTAGLERIRDNLGGASQPTWMHAARALGELNADIYPDYKIHDWLRLVRRTHRLTPEGRIVADYDKQIAAPLKMTGSDEAVDMWPAYRALADMPLLILRGELSDILAADTAQKMADMLPLAQLTEVPRVGHAPTLDEPEALAAIDGWMAALPTS
jgi:pimeloyl-ACP methyl ester carboxylesterase